MRKDSKIYVAGHRGMVGSAIVRTLQREGYENIVVRTSSELDLRNQQEVIDFFAKENPEYVFLAAAKVGGIIYQTEHTGEFIYDNLMIEANLIHQSYVHQVKKLLFLGSSCAYPKYAPQPLKEEYLLTGSLEPTNELYAIAKIAGIKMCDAYRKQYGCDFISAMPTNLYGPNDTYDLNKAHVLPALMRKFHEAKINGEEEVIVWGSGKPSREFLHVDDLANACLFLMNIYSQAGPINIGVGEDITIRDLAELIKELVGYGGEIKFDDTKPDGTSRKLMEVSKMNTLGWKAGISLQDGIQKAYKEFKIKPLHIKKQIE